MPKDKRIDIVNIILNEIKNKEKLKEESIYMEMHESLCNEVLYTNTRYKESAIILTSIFNNLMSDFIKEVYDCIHKEGVYKHE